LFGDTIIQKCSNLISSIDVDKWRFVVEGPFHSGRSTVAGLLAKSAIQKLSSAVQLCRVFAFPVNWERAVQQLTDVSSLYEFLVTQVVHQLQWQCTRVFPVAQSLLNWFLSLPTSPILPTLPFTISKMPLFPVTQIEVVARRILSAHKSSPADFVTVVVALPWAIASCFGFDRFLYIYDHLDMLDRRLGDNGALLQNLCDHISSQLFIASAKTRFPVDRLAGAELELVQMEGFVPAQLTDQLRTITTGHPTFALPIDACRGCPQFVAKFAAIVDLLEASEKQKAESDRKRGFVAVNVALRQRVAAVQTVELCRDLIEFGVDGVDDQLCADMSSNPRFNVLLKRKGRA
jgi:hypothetical protein